MIPRLTTAALLALAAAPSPAQDLAFSIAPTATCFARAADTAAAQACIGRAAAQCTEVNGYATPVLSGCASYELDWWDGQLNAIYQERRAQAREIDAEAPDRAPSQAEALRDMQRAWIPFRDATCSFEASLWGGGTGAGPAFMQCLLRVTAEQAIYLDRGGLGR